MTVLFEQAIQRDRAQKFPNVRNLKVNFEFNLDTEQTSSDEPKQLDASIAHLCFRI